ncbi:MAG TPA: hypothetical protein VE776_00925 [Actinomycetota bacterium]|jgi:uncharacterized membrane protein YgcG|nr:hypothetical protein [Actinomycetota bacterium]
MRVRSLLAAAAMAAVALVIATPAFAADSSTAAQSTSQAPVIPLLVAVRSAHHPGFDRITFEFRGPRPSHRIGYVSQLVRDGSGEPVDLAGGAAINVVFSGANAHDEQGRPTVSPRRFEPGLPSLKEVALIGDFEAVVTYGLGVDHKVPFKVLELSNPSRIAIDISTGSSSGGTVGGGSGASQSGSGASRSGSGTRTPGALPFTGSRTTRLALEGLGLLVVGLLVLTLARATRGSAPRRRP